MDSLGVMELPSTFWPFMWSTISLPLFGFLFLMHLLYIFGVHFTPLTASVLIGNPYTSLAAQNWGPAAVNFQTLNMLLYHTTASDRLLHIVAFCLDGFGFALLAFALTHVLNPAVLAVFPAAAAVLGAIPLSLGTVVILMTFLSLVLQGNSYGGYRLATMTALFWAILFGMASFVYSSLFTLCSSFSSAPPSSSAPLYVSSVMLSWAMKLHLFSGVLRTVGHMVDYQRWGIVGNIQVVGSYGLSRLALKPIHTLRNAFPWSSNPLQNLRFALLLAGRLVISYISALTAELNAGLPCRLIPVSLHMLALRLNLYEDERYAYGENEWMEKRKTEESNKVPVSRDARTVEQFLLRMEELNEWTTGLIEEGIQNPIPHEDAACESGCSLHANCRRWRWCDADSRNPLHYLRQQEFTPREISGRRLPDADPRSHRRQSVHMVLPLEQKGYQVWGLWPEMPQGAERKAEDPTPRVSRGSGNTPQNGSPVLTSPLAPAMPEPLEATPAAIRALPPLARSPEKQAELSTSSSSPSSESGVWLTRNWRWFFASELPVCMATCVFLLMLNYREYERLLSSPASGLQPHLDSLLSFSVAANVLFCSYCYLYGRLLFNRSAPNAPPQPPCRRSFYLLQEAMLVGDVIVVAWNIAQAALCPAGSAACVALSAHAWTACLPALFYGGLRAYWMAVCGDGSVPSTAAKTLKKD